MDIICSKCSEPVEQDLSAVKAKFSFGNGNAARIQKFLAKKRNGMQYLNETDEDMQYPDNMDDMDDDDDVDEDEERFAAVMAAAAGDDSDDDFGDSEGNF